MKKKLSKIAQDLEQGTITDTEARNLLLDLLIVNESTVCDNCGGSNPIICKKCYDAELRNREY